MKSEKKERGKKKGFLDLLLGKRVIIQSKYGIIYDGIFTAKDGDYYILTNAKVIGRKNIAHVDLIGIKHNVIAHIHVKPKKVEPVQQ